MPFTTLADAIAASRSGVMDQVYANYDAALNRSSTLDYLNSTQPGVDPSISFVVTNELDQSYIDQITSELEATGWFRVSVKRGPAATGGTIFNVKAYKNENPPQATPKPQVPDQADEEDGIPGAGEVGAPVTTPAATEPAATQSTATEPAAAEPAASDSSTATPAPTGSETSSAPAEGTTASADTSGSQEGTSGSEATPTDATGEASSPASDTDDANKTS